MWDGPRMAVLPWLQCHKNLVVYTTISALAQHHYIDSHWFWMVDPQSPRVLGQGVKLQCCTGAIFWACSESGFFCFRPYTACVCDTRGCSSVFACKVLLLNWLVRNPVFISNITSGVTLCFLVTPCCQWQQGATPLVTLRCLLSIWFGCLSVCGITPRPSLKRDFWAAQAILSNFCFQNFFVLPNFYHPKFFSPPKIVLSCSLFMHFWMFHAILTAIFSPKFFLQWAVGEARCDTMLPSILVCRLESNRTTKPAFGYESRNTELSCWKQFCGTSLNNSFVSSESRDSCHRVDFHAFLFVVCLTFPRRWKICFVGGLFVTAGQVLVRSFAFHPTIQVVPIIWNGQKIRSFLTKAWEQCDRLRFFEKIRLNFLDFGKHCNHGGVCAGGGFWPNKIARRAGCIVLCGWIFKNAKKTCCFVKTSHSSERILVSVPTDAVILLVHLAKRSSWYWIW